MAKEIKLTDGTAIALEALATLKTPITLNDLNELNDSETKIASAHLSALKRYGLADSVIVEVPVTKMVKVNAYFITDAGKSFESK